MKEQTGTSLRRTRIVTLRGASADLDLAVDLDPKATWSNLVEELATAGLADPGHPIPVDGQLPRPDAPLVDLAVDGRILGLQRPSSASDRPGWYLEVCSGPDVGLRVPLGPTPCVVGRGDDADVEVDDPYLSRHNFQVEVSDAGRIRLEDLGSANGTVVDDEVIVGPREIAPDQRFEAGASVFAVRYRSAGTPSVDGTVPFNRIPYQRPLVRSREVATLTIPSFDRKTRRIGVAAAVGPLLGAVLFATVMKNPMYLWFAAMSPVIAVWGHFDEKRTTRKDREEAIVEFRRLVDSRLTEAYKLGTLERSERWSAAPDLAELDARAAFRQRDLWERSPADPDFTELRVGIGAVSSSIKSPQLSGGDEALLMEAREKLTAVETVDDAPVTISLSPKGAVGQGLAIVGPPELTASMARTLLAQLFTLHSPTELVVVSALSEHPAYAQLHEAGKWAPHTRSDFSPLPGAWHVSSQALLPGLLSLIARRNEPDRPKDTIAAPHVVALVSHDAINDASARLTDVLEGLANRAVSLIWLGEDIARVPKGCATQLVAGHEDWTLRTTTPGTPDATFAPELLAQAGFERLCRSLAPVQDISAERDDASIPARLTLSEAMRVDFAPDALADTVARWWSSPKKGIKSTIGAGRDGDMVLDLVSDGPHGLVAGTSGAGKSEFLQTLLASIAANYSPDEVVFLLIDYKGGAATKDLKQLPHTVGVLTDLDGALALRALASLRAELVRREHLLAGKARDVNELRAVDPANAPPSLIIAVDEFAFLKIEVPDFVPGIVDVAARGRSLGVHLVLATQRPAGSVSQDIQANTNLKVALRVVDKQDSTDVLNAPDAAAISRALPGRGFVRREHGQLEEFQTAWAGAPLRVDKAQRPVHLSPLLPSGHPMPRAAESGDDEDSTELLTLIGAARAANERLGLKTPHRPWVEPLPAVMTTAELTELIVATGGDPRLQSEPGRFIAVGAEDVPSQQCWKPLVIDLESSGGLLVAGSGGSGKSTTLRTIAAQATAAAPHAPPVIYTVDFGTSGLKALSDLPNLAGSATKARLDRVCQLVERLEHESSVRQVLLADHGASMWSQIPPEVQAANPRVLVLIDDLGALKRTFVEYETPDAFRWYERLLQLIVDGRAVGIHTMASVTDYRSVGIALDVLAARLCLYLSNPDRYLEFNVAPAVAKTRTQIPGRAIYGADREAHVAVLTGPSMEEQRVQLRAIAQDTARLSSSDWELRDLPSDVALDEVPPVVADELGFGVADIPQRTGIGWEWRGSVLSVIGPRGSGRTTTLETLTAAAEAAGVAQHRVDGAPEVDPETGAPAEWASSEAAAAFVGIVLVDGLDKLSSLPELSALISSRTMPPGWGVAVTASPAEVDDYRYVQILQATNTEDAGLFVQPSDTQRRFFSTAPRLAQAFPPGRAVFEANGTATTVQVARS